MDLPSIAHIDLTSNRLYGNLISPSINNSNIKVLLLSQNRFSGMIPVMENMTVSLFYSWTQADFDRA